MATEISYCSSRKLLEFASPKLPLCINYDDGNGILLPRFAFALRFHFTVVFAFPISIHTHAHTDISKESKTSIIQLTES
jgi:hypothetical protein